MSFSKSFSSIVLQVYTDILKSKSGQSLRWPLPCIVGHSTLLLTVPTVTSGCPLSFLPGLQKVLVNLTAIGERPLRSIRYICLAGAELLLIRAADGMLIQRTTLT